MCGAFPHNHQHAASANSSPVADDFVLDLPRVRNFIAGVRAAIARAAGPAEAIEMIRPAFATLLRDDWLPAEFQADAPQSGMGSGIGQWLLFRAGARDLSFFALVIPPGAATPIHDHLAWGLIGLYRGEQEESVFARRDDSAPVGEREVLQPTLRRVVRQGDFYPLLPPTDDIHQVRTTSSVTSVSLHLLANDTGCVWRHAYDLDTAVVRPFRSGYVNQPCEGGSAL